MFPPATYGACSFCGTLQPHAPRMAPIVIAHLDVDGEPCRDRQAHHGEPHYETDGTDRRFNFDHLMAEIANWPDSSSA